MGIFIIGLVFVSGCDIKIFPAVDNIGGPNSLKDYFESDLPNFPQEPPFNVYRVVAVVDSISGCSNRPDGEINDCYGRITVSLSDKDYPNYKQKFDLSIRQFPYYALDYLKEGMICHFYFEGYNVKDVLWCEGVPDEIIENAKDKIVGKGDSVSSSLEKISLIRTSGFTLPEDSFSEEIILDFGSSIYTREYHTGSAPNNPQNFFENIPNAQELADEIELIILKGDLLNYELNTGCYVADAGGKTLTFVYKGVEYTFDLVPLTLCDDEIDSSEQALLEIAEIVKERGVIFID